MNEEKKPKEYDAVLGVNNLPPVDGLVLGGIEGIKHKLSSNSVTVKIAAIRNAMQYGESGEALLFEVMEAFTGDILWEAFKLLWNNCDEKQKLFYFFPKLVKDNVKKWNIWRSKNTGIEIDFQQVDFSQTNLSQVNFSNINLTGANLIQTTLTGSDLSHANLSHADLNCACLVDANLASANFSHSNLMDAHLQRAYFGNANLSNADFTGADLTSANFYNSKIINTNFSWANLETISLYQAEVFEVNLYNSTTCYYSSRSSGRETLTKNAKGIIDSSDEVRDYSPYDDSIS